MECTTDAISLEPVDRFEKFERRLEAENILHDLYKIDFQIFVSVSFVFSWNFSLILTFRCIRPI